MTYQPSISIIIAVKNAKYMLQESLASIERQQYPHLEVIVVDGDSQDGTKAMLQKTPIVSKWISEKDRGISDAFNKGIAMATGEYIYFLGAGDTFYSEDCVSKLFDGLNSEVMLICGSVMRVKEDGCTPLWIAPKKYKKFNVQQFLFRLPLPHQGLFTHRRFFSQFGLFDLKVKFAMDYELLLRAYHTFPKTIVKKEIIVAKWRAGGVGTHRILEIFQEYNYIKQRHKVASRFILWAVHLFTLLKYFIKAKCLRMGY